MEVGQEILTRCPRCKHNLAHLIEVTFQGKIIKVMCLTCKKSRKYKEPVAKKNLPPKEPKEIKSKQEKKTSLEEIAEYDEIISKAVPKDYKMAAIYKLNDVIRHSKFGIGIVKKVNKDNIQVNFQLEKKLLVHGYKLA